MNIEKVLDWIIGALIVAVLTFAGISMYGAHVQNKNCEAAGGILLKTYAGHACIVGAKVSTA